MGNVSAHLFVTGIVQGVFFRESMRRVAESRHVVGWVRNLPDGCVEAVLEGEEENVRAVANWCQHGPSRAEVDGVDVRWGEETGQFRSFAVR